MYGKPLKPNKTSFICYIDDDSTDFSSLWGEGQVAVELFDDDDCSNDGIRDIDHPDFEKYWDNASEGCFTTDHFKTVEEASDWLKSIGMTQIFDRP